MSWISYQHRGQFPFDWLSLFGYAAGTLPTGQDLPPLSQAKIDF